MGFVNKVTAPAALDTAAQAYCDQILAVAPLAIRASKMKVPRGLTEESLELAMARQEGYPEFKGAKRDAVWQGK
jgi:enoyl-CoA hydratase/carnithine racemase